MASIFTKDLNSYFNHNPIARRKIINAHLVVLVFGIIAIFIFIIFIRQQQSCTGSWCGLLQAVDFVFTLYRYGTALLVIWCISLFSFLLINGTKRESGSGVILLPEAQNLPKQLTTGRKSDLIGGIYLAFVFAIFPVLLAIPEIFSSNASYKGGVNVLDFIFVPFSLPFAILIFAASRGIKRGEAWAKFIYTLLSWVLVIALVLLIFYFYLNYSQFSYFYGSGVFFGIISTSLLLVLSIIFAIFSLKTL